MADTTDIEKKSLEAHVELCAERYRFLEQKLSTLDVKISEVVASVVDVKHAVDSFNTKNNDRLIMWGAALIGCLASICGYLITHFVIQ